MTKRRRRFLFFILIIVFLLLTPVLLLYSTGYIFDIQETRLERTGGIFIKSKTPRLSLFLDGTFVKETSFFSGGAILTPIKPGTHSVRIEKPGYLSWFKTVEVDPAVVTELRYIILLPHPVPYATSTPEELRRLSAKEETVSGPFKLNSKGNLIETKDGQTSVALQNVHSFEVLNNTLWWVDKNGFLARRILNGGDIRTLARPGFFLEKERPLRFTRSPSGEVAILDGSGGLFLVRGEDEILTFNGNIFDVQFDREGEKALLRKEKGLEVVWLKEYRYQPFTPPGAHEKIIEVSETIKDAIWYQGDNMHVLFRTAGGIYLTEIDGRGGRNTLELVSGFTDELAVHPDFPNAAFFLKGKQWFKIEI